MTRRPYQTAPAVPDSMSVDPNCACAFVRCDPGSPYCEVTRLAGARCGLLSLPKDGRSLSEQYLAEFDQIAAFHRSEAAKRAGVPTTGVSAAVQPPVVAPRRKRRTKAEMAEFRAATQSRIDAAAREVTPDWLNEPDEMLEQILGQPHDD